MFSDILTKSINKNKAKTFKTANRYSDVENAKKKVLKILADNRKVHCTSFEFKDNFIIEIDGVRYYSILNQQVDYNMKYEKNQELKILNLGKKKISIAELINKYNKKEVRFLQTVEFRGQKTFTREIN